MQHQIERQRDEVVMINGHIRVTVIEVHDDEVTVAIESDREPGASRIETLRVSPAGQVQLELVGV